MQQRPRTLVQEAGPDLLGQHPVGRIGRLEQHRQVGHLAADVADQLDAGLRVRLAAAVETHVGDDAEEVLAVAFEQLEGLFVGLGDEDLGPGPQAQQAVHAVEPLLHDAAGLLDDLAVEHRQQARAVAHRVLDQDDHPHARDLGVVVGVPAVFDDLDDRQEQLRVALPDVQPVGGQRPAALAQAGQLEHVGGQHHQRQLGPAVLDRAGKGDDVHVRQAEHADDQVERLAFDGFEGLAGVADAGDAGLMAQTQVDVLAEDQLGQQAVLFEDERVVRAADQQDAVHPPGHQLRKTPQPPFVTGADVIEHALTGRFGTVVDDRHGSDLLAGRVVRARFIVTCRSPGAGSPRRRNAQWPTGSA